MNNRNTEEKKIADSMKNYINRKKNVLIHWMNFANSLPVNRYEVREKMFNFEENGN